MEDGEYNYQDDEMYDNCPTCGETWDKHTKDKLSERDICNPLTILMLRKPRFYTQDIENYNEEFLKRIILWQEEYINYLKKENV